ncbi:hypothetical protein NMY22_g18454 [Coprinellus aureogranulatus]|nr:hypothetical protein NMY22_g18454 [Coprinellus aureogranulatus]
MASIAFLAKLAIIKVKPNDPSSLSLWMNTHMQDAVKCVIDFFESAQCKELHHSCHTSAPGPDNTDGQHKGRTIKGGSDEETTFISQIRAGLAVLLHALEPLDMPEVVHSKRYTITVKFKPWWGETCQAVYDKYREDNSPDTCCAFCAAVRAAKQEFFDNKVTEISIDHKPLWDLMARIQAIQFNGQPCHTTNQLWQAQHGTYNAAKDRPVNLSILVNLPSLEPREWPVFSELELRQAPEVCLSRSAPGPDHVTWRHLKAILSTLEAPEGYPFNTRGGLHGVEPLPSKCLLRYDMIKYDLVNPNQMGGVCQHSTKDTSLFLTHLVCTGWVKGYHTSVVAFDIAQFFPSINHQFLLAVLRKQGFHHKVATFFASYLVQRFTRYAWNNFVSDPMQADVGVGQGSALSPVLSALVVAPIMKLYWIKEVGLGTTLITFVNNGTIATQTDSIELNCCTLYYVYTFIHVLFTAASLVLEHDKSEAFHFTRARSSADRPIDLGFAPHMCTTTLRPKKFWHYLGFYFDQKLTFTEHMHRLWFYKGAKNVGALKTLSRMQCKAAIWIMGAFCMSPTGGSKLLAGLPPIRLQLRKLSERAVFRMATLSNTHPLRSLMPEEMQKGAKHHYSIACWLTPLKQEKVWDVEQTTTYTVAYRRLSVDNVTHLLY